jgi:hypothetical protein
MNILSTDCLGKNAKNTPKKAPNSNKNHAKPEANLHPGILQPFEHLKTDPTLLNCNVRHAEPDASPRCGYLPSASKTIIKHIRSHQNPKQTKSLQTPISATLNPKKSLQTIPTTPLNRLQTPFTLSPATYHPCAIFQTSSILRPILSNTPILHHHRAQACPAHHTQAGAPTPSYKAASLYGRSQRTGCVWASPRGNIR